MTDIVTTERLTLRLLELADAPALHAIANDFDMVKMTATWPWPVSLEFVEGKIRTFRERQGPESYGCGIFLDDTLIGNMGGGVQPHPQTEEPSIWIGYMIGKNWWGQGLMTEALVALCEELRKRLPPLEIYAEHHFDNPASGRVMLKAGFVYDCPSPPLWCKARQESIPGERYRFAPSGK